MHRAALARAAGPERRQWPRKRARALAASAAVLAAATTAPSNAAPDIHPLRPADLGVVINLDDRLSVAIGNYYIAKRKIPAANVVRVSFDPNRDEVPTAEFNTLRTKVQAATPANVQAYALTWARPYRAGCMSITSAFAFGFDPKYCATGCKLTAPSPYFNAPSERPFNDLHIRPAMALAASDFVSAQKLIDRGIQSDASFPKGSAYLVTTNDVARNARIPQYKLAARDSNVRAELVDGTGIRDRSDVLFYFIGAQRVTDLESNRFLPGAVADHLTSFGGMLTDSSQMSSLRWIEAGATGSYGTVVEPCAFPSKFPDIRVLMWRYQSGETLIESYWKSVAMPGQGIFIGEPLAAPFHAHVR